MAYEIYKKINENGDVSKLEIAGTVTSEEKSYWGGKQDAIQYITLYGNSGTLTEEQKSILSASDENYIVWTGAFSVTGDKYIFKYANDGNNNYRKYIWHNDNSEKIISVRILSLLSATWTLTTSNLVKTTRTINGKALSIDIILKTSDLTNDSGYITSSDIVGKQDSTDNSLTTTDKTIVGAINEVSNKVNGMVFTKTYNSIQEMVTALNSMSATEMKVGNNIYIVSESPDLWIGKIEESSSTYTYTTDTAFINALTNSLSTTVQVGYYRLLKLETEKVDLTDYVKKTTTIAGVDLQDNITASELKTALSLGNVENKSSATIRGELTSSNVTTALGFTPYNSTNPNNYISGIDSTMVTTALGFIPYSSTNPNGYTSNTGTVTSVAVKMNGSTKGTVTTSGEIDLGTVITSHQDISGKMDKTNPTGTGSISINRLANSTVGNKSATFGDNCEASGENSFASGSYTTASSPYTTASGLATTASSSWASANGYRTRASKSGQFVFGELNIADNENNPLNRWNSHSGRYVEIVGNGTQGPGSTPTFTYSNARTLDWNGNEVLAGTSQATGFKTANGTSSQFLKADGSVDNNSYITGITSSMVTTALGFTPYNSTNPNGYITSSSNITGSSYGVADLGNRNAILGIQWAGDWTYTDGGGIPVYASDGNLRPMQWATVKGRVGVPTFTLSGTTLTIS